MLISVTLLMGFTANLKAEVSHVISVSQINSDLFAVSVLINGTIIIFTVDGIHKDIVDVY